MDVLDTETQELIGALYDAAAAQRSWSDALTRAMRLFGATGALLGRAGPGAGRRALQSVADRAWTTLGCSACLDRLIDTHLLSPPDDGCGVSVRRVTMAETELLCGPCRHRHKSDGTGGALGLTARDDAAGCVFLLLCAPERTDLGPQDCARMRALAPHILRAVRVHAEIAGHRAALRAVHGALDGLALGLLLVDVQLRVRYRNGLAQRAMARLAGPPVRDNALSPDGALGAAVLRRLSARGAVDETLRLADGRDGTVLAIVSAAPDDGLGPSGGRTVPMALVRLVDLAADQTSRKRVLQRAFGLSPRQAAFADLLGRGRSLKQAACDLGITEASARTYSKRVFEKLGVNRQSDLVRQIARLPAF